MSASGKVLLRKKFTQRQLITFAKPFVKAQETVPPKKPIQTRVQLPGLAGDDLWSASVAVDRVGFNHYLEIPPLLSDGTDGFKFGGSQQIARSLRPLRRNAGYDNDRLSRQPNRITSHNSIVVGDALMGHIDVHGPALCPP